MRGRKQIKWLRVAGQVWDWTLLFCCSGGLRMKPGFVLVCQVWDSTSCLNFMMALNNSKKLGVYVSMHGERHHQYYSELSLIRKFNCIALTWTEKLETPIFPENICIFTQHHWCLVERWRRGFTWERFDKCYLKMQRSLVLYEEVHFQTGKWVHNILWKPLEVWVSLVSLQKLPCLHSSHSVLVTICERHFKADFSKPGSACAFQTLLPTPQLSRICRHFKKLYVLRKSSVG